MSDLPYGSRVEPNPLIINRDGTQSPNPYYRGHHPYRRGYDGKLIPDWKTKTTSPSASAGSRMAGAGVTGSVAAALAKLIPYDRLSNEAIRGLGVVLGFKTPFADNKLLDVNDIRSVGSTDYNVATPEGAAAYKSALGQVKSDGNNVRESNITYKGKVYNLNDPKEYREYTKLMRADNAGKLSNIPATDVNSRDQTPEEPVRAFTPEYQELYDYGKANSEAIQKYYKDRGEDNLAIWAKANPALAAKEFMKGSGRDLAQDLLEKHVNKVIQGEFSTASRTQVPNFAPDSVNLNFGVEKEGDFGPINAYYEDFRRNNTTPAEVFDIKNQIGF